MNLCSFGFHDWEYLQTLRIREPGTLHTRLHKRICMRCGKREDEITEYVNEVARENDRRMRRRQKAEKMWESHGDQNEKVEDKE